MPFHVATVAVLLSLLMLLACWADGDFIGCIIWLGGAICSTLAMLFGPSTR